MVSERLFLSKKETAERLGISIPTINRHIRDNIIPHKKLSGRILIPVSWVENLAKVEESA